MPLITREYKDINLNFTIHPLTGDITKLTAEDAVKESLKRLILTNYYERFFHPEIGSSVPGLLFDNASPITAIQIERSCREVINNFEPRVNISSIQVNLNPDSNYCKITIVFYILNMTVPVALDVILERLR